MSESSATNFVYSRRKLQGNTIDFLSTITERSGEDCPCVINLDGPSVPAKEHHVVSEEEHETEAVIESFMLPFEGACVVSKDQHESGTGGALPRPPPVCNGEPHVSKSESSCGCSLVEDQDSVEASKKSRLKIIEVDGINDSCSSSKSNMELVSVSTKTEGHDNGECSSSTVMAAEFAGEDQSEKHRCISTLGKQRVFEGICPGKTRASSKRIVDGSGSSSSRSCKKCFLKESPEKMLLCDSCEDSFHVSCCNPHVKRIPIDEWLCSSCLKKKRIIPKERISRKTLNIISDMSRCRDASSTK
ncbi:hypothetical protein OIU84_001032 [Salix udensis]|uniref:PHD-type domain-containing protein n=1 Tax=Salix udensis TaxID=889485 RepID=A0AAD6L607_9ROSI|nr:hypothetical protein OIU84_001032 [Salix udensis]